MGEPTSKVSGELEAFAAALKLNRFGVGRHIVRNERGWRERNIEVRAIWVASISPSFHPGSYLLVMHTESHPLSLFCLRGIDSLPNIQGEPFECPGLEDKVAKKLKHVDLFPSERVISLDGIGYSLRIRTFGVSTDLEFSNPGTESLRAVEKALFEVAESIARITNRNDISDYLNTWKKYLS